MVPTSESNLPLVSIITPCYNGEDFLDAYFKSVLNQTYPKIELIFVNDGSTDSTEKIALSYKKAMEEKGYVYRYIYQENSGQASAINKGLKVFAGEYLTWPDSDDIMCPNCIEEKVNYLINHPDKGIVLCKIAKIYENNPDNIKEILQRKNTGKEYIFEDLLYANDIFFAPIGYMVNSKFLLDSLKKREIYESRAGQNWQMLLPISYYCKCGFLDSILGYYTVRSNSHSHQTTNDSYQKQINMYEGHYDIIEKTLLDMNIPDLESHLKKVRAKYYYIELSILFGAKDIKQFKKTYKSLKKLEKISEGTKDSYYELCYPLLYKVYQKIIKTRK